MATKDIVLYQGPDSRSAVRLDTAVDLAKTHDARIIGVFVKGLRLGVGADVAHRFLGIRKFLRPTE